jgi:hypothetical protein
MSSLNPRLLGKPVHLFLSISVDQTKTKNRVVLSPTVVKDRIELELDERYEYYGRVLDIET